MHFGANNCAALNIFSVLEKKKKKLQAVFSINKKRKKVANE